MSWLGWLLVGTGCAVTCVVVSLSVLLRRHLSVATVRGFSMEPTFDDGTRVLVVRRDSYAVGEVIVFRAFSVGRGDPAWRVKRVAAVAGDPVPAWMGDTDHATVPAGGVVVVGDNPRSQDSRHLGFVSLDVVAGRVTRVLSHHRRSRSPAAPAPAAGAARR
ncbi:MAG: S26 family signal peptidase [Actinocatenispora sp.]